MGGHVCKTKRKDFNRNGWGIKTWKVKNGEEDMEVELISRKMGTQRQYEEGKILKAKYNKKYREISAGEEGPRYLRKENLDEISRRDEVRALIKLRCGNIEQENQYWLGEIHRACLFCGEGKDCLEHYVRECQDIKKWFKDLGGDEEEIINRIWRNELDGTKGRTLRKLWKEREKVLRRRTQDNFEGVGGREGGRNNRNG